MAVIEVENLRRVYRSRTSTFKRGLKEVEALRGVSFSVDAGELFGLLGPNGAGKTTTIKILTTLLLPTSGSARVLGLDAATQHRELRSRIGYVFGGDRGLYDRLSGLDNLKFFADVYRVPIREQEPADRRAAGHGRPPRTRAGARRDVLARDAPATAHRPRAAPRPAR